LRVVNEHSEPVFNEASPSAATFRTEPRQNGILRRFHWSVRRANGLAILVGDGLAFAIVVCQYLVHFVIGKGLGAAVGFPFLCGFIFCISKLFQCDSADRY
ncbi:hypothetical protein WBQ28_15310, partial [Pseudomonas syringae pv. syringae]|uniref:hypothetical protein n=1 Tax=Pseudomonas syringae TaxID=317 RepID=UPI003B0031DE